MGGDESPYTSHDLLLTTYQLPPTSLRIVVGPQGLYADFPCKASALLAGGPCLWGRPPWPTASTSPFSAGMALP